MKKYEQQFLSELGKAYKARGYHFFKIPDTMGERFSITKPYDVIAFAEGLGQTIEAKSFNGLQAVPLNALRINQVKGLNEAHLNGSCAFVMAHFRVSKGVERAYAIPWPQMRLKCHLKDETIKELYRLGQRDPELPRLLTGSVKKKELDEFEYIEKIDGKWVIEDWVKSLWLTYK